MAGKKANIKALFSNTRSRVIIIFTAVLLVIAVVVGLFKFSSIMKPATTAGASLSSAPGSIQSVPGAINPTAQYAALQEKQNVEQAQQAAKTGASAIPTIIRAQAFGEGVESVGPQNGEGGVGFEALAREDTTGPQQSLWLQNVKNANCSKASVDSAVNQGAMLKDLKGACTCVQLKFDGYKFPDLQSVCSCKELKAAGFNARQFKEAGYTAGRLRLCGFSACELRGAGFTAQEMKDGGFSDGELKGAGFTDAEIARAGGLPDGITPEDVRQAGCNADALSKLRQQGVSAAAVRRISGCSAAQLKAAGFSAQDLKNAGFSAADLLKAGFTPDQLKTAGYSARDLLNAGLTPAELAAAGFTPDELKAAENELPPGVTPEDVKASGCNIDALKKERLAGVSATLIHQYAGCSAQALKAAGFTDNDLANAGFTPQQIKAASALVSDAEIKAAGCDPTKLKDLFNEGVAAKRIRDLNGCSAQALKDAGYDAKELVGAGFTPQQLLAAGFTPEQVNAAQQVSDAAIKAAGCDPTQLKKLFAEGVSATRIRDLNGCSAATLKAAGYDAKQLAAAGYTPKELLAAGFTPAEIKAAEATVSDAAIRSAGCDPQKIHALYLQGVSAARIRDLNGCSAAALKASGYDAKQLAAAGFTPQQLLGAGFTPAEVTAAEKIAGDAAIKAAGCDPQKLHALLLEGVSAKRIHALNNCSAEALKTAGFNATELADAGFTPQQLLAAGFTPAEVEAANPISDSTIKAVGCDPQKLHELFLQGVSAARIRELNGCSAEALKAAGYSASNLSNAGFTPEQLLAAGFTPDQLKKAGLSTAGVIAAGRVADCSVASLKAARALGVSATTIQQTLGCNAKQLKDAGYTAAELKAAGFTAADLKDAGFSAQDLKNAGFTAKELRAAGFSAAELKNAGYSAEQLKAAGYTAKELKDAGFSAEALRKAGYTAKELKNAGFTAAQLKNAGYSAQDIQDAGFSASDSSLASLDNPSQPPAPPSMVSLPSFGGPAPSNKEAAQAASTKQLQEILKRQQTQLADQRYQQKIQAKTTAMMSTASQELQAWKSVSAQTYMAGLPPSGKGAAARSELGESGTRLATQTQIGGARVTRAVIKTGDILFAVIDTSVNSDEPGPILATIVSGKLKGSKLIGSFTLPANADKMVITFRTLSVPGAAKVTSINAYAIDPNTARTALSSRANHHYLSRYGSLFAATFLEGFGNAFQSANTTITIGGTGGVSNTTVQNGVGRSILENAVIGLATLGKSWGQIAMQNVNRPITVDLYSGTGVGVLFTQDVESI